MKVQRGPALLLDREVRGRQQYAPGMPLASRLARLRTCTWLTVGDLPNPTFGWSPRGGTWWLDPQGTPKIGRRRGPLSPLRALRAQRRGRR